MVRKIFFAGILFGGLFFLFGGEEALSITIDGNFDDWETVSVLGADNRGDVSTGDIVDWADFRVTDEKGVLYLSYETNSAIDFASNAWRYNIFVDTDNNPATGYKYLDGSFLIGAEYMIQGATIFEYAGNGTSWEWNRDSIVAYSVNGNKVEIAIPEIQLGLGGRYRIQIMFFGDNPTTKDYAKDDKAGFQYVKAGIDHFEYATNEDLDSVYDIECDPGTFAAAYTDSNLPYAGDYCARLNYTLGSLWSSIKLVRRFTVSEDWSKDRKLTLWVKGYLGCTENLLIYVIESDGDEWVYQNNTVLINDAWTKIVVSLDDLWDNPWDGGVGDGVRTLNEVMGYKIVVQDIANDGVSPINKNIYIDEFLIDDGVASEPHLIPDGFEGGKKKSAGGGSYQLIPNLNNHVCYYGKNKVDDLANFDLVIIDTKNYDPQAIADMKTNGSIVVGYVSIGEDARILPGSDGILGTSDDEPLSGDGTGPITTNGGAIPPTLTYAGYASYYLDENPKDNYPDKNGNWNSYYINAGNAEWQDYIINALIDEIINVKGCDGIFIDTIGIVDEQPWYAWTKPGMISLIADIRAACPNKYIIANRGFSLFDDIEQYINVVMFESFTSSYDFALGIYREWNENELAYTAVFADQLNADRGYPDNISVNVVALDYCEPDDVSVYANDYIRAEEFGFIPNISDIWLSKMYMLNPAENLNVFYKATQPQGIILKWDASEERINDSNVDHYIIKRSEFEPITEDNWDNMPALVESVGKYETMYTDYSPLVDGEVYYGIKAVKEGTASLDLIGLPTTSIDYRAVEDIEVDGDFEDWSGLTPVIIDDSADVSAEDIVDWTYFWALSENGNLYLSYETVSDIDFTDNAWRYNIFIDIDNDASTGYEYCGVLGVEYMIQGGTLFKYSGDGSTWDWIAVSGATYAVDGNKFEIEIPESLLELSAPYAIKVMLFGDNEEVVDESVGFVRS